MARQKRFADSSSPESENPALQTDDTQCKKKKKRKMREIYERVITGKHCCGFDFGASSFTALRLPAIEVCLSVRFQLNHGYIFSARYSLHQHERPAQRLRLLGPWMDHGKSKLKSRTLGKLSSVTGKRRFHIATDGDSAFIEVSCLAHLSPLHTVHPGCCT